MAQITIEEIAAAYDRMHPQTSAVASAVKRGRWADRPYVPVVLYPERGRSHNPCGRVAFATREDAIAAAQNVIDYQRTVVCAQMAEPRHRALREQYGLPREIEVGH